MLYLTANFSPACTLKGLTDEVNHIGDLFTMQCSAQKPLNQEKDFGTLRFHQPRVCLIRPVAY